MMKKIGFLVLIVGFLLWFLAGFSIYNKPLLGSLYGETWQMASFFMAALGVMGISIGYIEKR